MSKILFLKTMPLLMLFLFTAAGCHLLGADSGADEMSKLNSKIKELTNGSFEVPLHDDYPLVYAQLSKPPDEVGNGTFSIALLYSEDWYPVKAYWSEARMKELESHGISILYGPYVKDPYEPLYEGNYIMIEYSLAFKNVSVAISAREYDTGTWDINGQEVGYAYQGKEIIDAYLPMAEAGIIATYFLCDKFTEEDAKEFTAYLVNELY